MEICDVEIETMNDEKGNVLSEEEVLKDALNHLSETCCFAFELDGPEGIAFAVMCDNALKYGQAILNERDPRLSEEFLNQNG